MRLLTPELITRFAEIGAQDGTPDPIVVCKIIEKVTGDTLYVFEYLPRESELLALLQRGPGSNPHPELFGGFSLPGLEALRHPVTGDFIVHRDESFRECPFSKAVRERRHLVYRRLN